jgi:hypothetical protein
MDEKAAENRFFFLLKLQAFFFLASQRVSRSASRRGGEVGSATKFGFPVIWITLREDLSPVQPAAHSARCSRSRMSSC